MRQALGGGMGAGRLPPHMVFSDRDFNESDYEALLALDETIENRKGVLRRKGEGGGAHLNVASHRGIVGRSAQLCTGWKAPRYAFVCLLDD